MFSIVKNFIRVNDSLFLVKKTYREETIKNVDGVKEFTGSDHVFKNDGILYFCERIQELEIEVESTPILETPLIEEKKDE